MENSGQSEVLEWFRSDLHLDSGKSEKKVEEYRGTEEALVDETGGIQHCYLPFRRRMSGCCPATIREPSEI